MQALLSHDLLPSADSDRERAHFSPWDGNGVRLAVLASEGHGSSLTLPFPAMVRMMAATGPCHALLAHSHPSGDPRPSRCDIDATRRLWRAARLLDVRLHDHIIVGTSGWFSFRRAGLL